MEMNTTTVSIEQLSKILESCSFLFLWIEKDLRP